MTDMRTHTHADIRPITEQDLAAVRELALSLAIPPIEQYNLKELKKFYERMKYALIAA